jgi:hypothetical protein
VQVKEAEFEALLAQARALQDAGELPASPTDAQRADWAYGQAVIENPDVTREMAEVASFKNSQLEYQGSVAGKIEQIRGYGNTTAWEEEFLASIEREERFTSGQMSKLDDILEQCEERSYQDHVASKDD